MAFELEPRCLICHFYNSAAFFPVLFNGPVASGAAASGTSIECGEGGPGGLTFHLRKEHLEEAIVGVASRDIACGKSAFNTV